MLISILLGNVVGGFVQGFLGSSGAIFGAMIIGIAIYYLYSLLTGQKTFLMGAIVFGVLNYVSIWITSWIGSMTGLAGGIFGLIIQAIVLSLSWGWLGGKAQPQGTVKTGLKA